MAVHIEATSKQSTRILTWNANGLLSRKAELTTLLQTEDIDIALISETHLTLRLKADIRGYNCYPCNHPSGSSHGGSAETHLTLQLKADIRGYNCYPCNHPSGSSHGGSAVYIKKNLQHHEYQMYCTLKMQAAVITVQLHNGFEAQICNLLPSMPWNLICQVYGIFQHPGW